MRNVLFVIAFLLAACEPSEMYPAPVGIGGGGAGGSYQANPPASPLLAKPVPVEPSPSPSPVVQETHGVVNQQNCYDMEAKFKRQGRQVKLVETRRSTNPGAILRWICIFEGEDAQQGYFEEKRY